MKRITDDYCSHTYRVPTDITSGFEDKIKLSDKFASCFETEEHLGPGGNKYYAFQAVSKVAGANDVVLVVDGDDELNSVSALEIINKKYVDEKVWLKFSKDAFEKGLFG